MFDGVQSVLRRHKLDLVVLPCSTDEDPAEYLQRMVARRLVDAHDHLGDAAQGRRASTSCSKAAHPLHRARPVRRPAATYPWIDLDFEGVANRAVDRLVATGHRRIAVAVPSNDINLGFVFLDGYKAALARHGIAFDPRLVIRAASPSRAATRSPTKCCACAIGRRPSS